MTDAGFFRVSNSYFVLNFEIYFVIFQGTSAEQDNRFSDKQKKLLKQLKFNEILTQKVIYYEAVFCFYHVIYMKFRLIHQKSIYQ